MEMKTDSTGSSKVSDGTSGYEENIVDCYREYRVRFGRAAALVIVSITMIWSVQAIAATSNSKILQARIANALGDLQRFQSSRRVDDENSLGDLKSAIYTMQTATDVGILGSQNFIAERRSIVQGWTSILRAIEKSYDPSFDPNNLADIPSTIIPPEGFPPGVAPSAIQDPRDRATYTSALQQNTLKLKRAFYYQRIHSLDLSAMSILGTSLDLLRKVAPDGTPSDFSALDGIAQRAGLTGSRRTALDAMFYGHPQP